MVGTFVGERRREMGESRHGKECRLRNTFVAEVLGPGSSRERLGGEGDGGRQCERRGGEVNRKTSIPDVLGSDS